MTGRDRMLRCKQSCLSGAVLYVIACAWLVGCSRPDNDSLASVIKGLDAPPSGRTYELDIKRESGISAILDFARQTELNVSISPDLEKEPLTIGPLKDELTADDALTALLAQSGWTYEWVNHRTLVVQREIQPRKR